MIPKKKKSPEELAALREDLGIPKVPPPNPLSPQAPPTLPLPAKKTASIPAKKPDSPSRPAPKTTPPAAEQEELPPAPVLDPAHPDATPETKLREPLVHLDTPAAPALPQEAKSNSLRKHEPKLAPAPPVLHKTALPDRRHDDEAIARMRRQDTIAHIAGDTPDPAAHLRSMTAHPVLLAAAYLPAFASGVLAWKNFHYSSPLALLVLASILAGFIYGKKKRSRHHAAFLVIIILMTLAFGGLHYAPLFQNAP